MYGRVSPEATVETISFGTPTGRPRIAMPAIDELPEPPTETIPSSRPSACSFLTTSAAPRAMASTAAPRSPASASAPASAPAAAATSWRDTSGARSLRLEHARVDDQACRRPARAAARARYAYSWPFVSSVPRRTTVAISSRRSTSGAWIGFQSGLESLFFESVSHLLALAVRVDRDDRAVARVGDPLTVRRPGRVDLVDRGRLTHADADRRPSRSRRCPKWRPRALLENAICLLSGDQAGGVQRRLRFVSWWLPVPSGWTSQSSLIGRAARRRTYAIQRPSGDQAGSSQRRPASVRSSPGEHRCRPHS